MHAIAIIPAHGGSKSIPKKNMVDFCGHPLVARTIACCRGCRPINGIYVSADDPQITAIVRQNGTKMIVRPPERA